MSFCYRVEIARADWRRDHVWGIDFCLVNSLRSRHRCNHGWTYLIKSCYKCPRYCEAATEHYLQMIGRYQMSPIASIITLNRLISSFYSVIHSSPELTSYLRTLGCLGFLLITHLWSFARTRTLNLFKGHHRSFHFIFASANLSFPTVYRSWARDQCRLL